MNKPAAIILLCAINSIIASGQDTIRTKDDRKLNVKVTEQNEKIVRYRMTDYPDGPLKTIRTSRIKSIRYQNGTLDLVGNENPRRSKPLGIHAGFEFDTETEGYTMLFISGNYFIIPQIALEASAGTNTEGGLLISGGARFHLNRDRSEHLLTPFAGCLIGYFNKGFVKFPVGLNYMTRRGFDASLAVAPLIYFEEVSPTVIELKIGWRF